jgi:hypothetical protein
MKMQTAIALGAALLLSGATAASAAEAASSNSGMAKPASTLSLTGTQQKLAWKDMSSASMQKAPADFKATTGAAVPSTLKVSAVPSKTARDVPALKSYDFAKIQGKLLIVNPKDRTIADVIAG